MYNLDGICYHIFHVGGVMLAFSLLAIGMSFFKIFKKKHVKKLTIIVEIICVLFSFAYISYHSYKYFNPTIKIYEGEFFDGHRGRRGLTYDYSFSNGAGRRPVFYLDSLSKKSVYPEEFSKGKKYRIYYEEDLKIIVRVEELF